MGTLFSMKRHGDTTHRLFAVAELALGALFVGSCALLGSHGGIAALLASIACGGALIVVGALHFHLFAKATLAADPSSDDMADRQYAAPAVIFVEDAQTTETVSEETHAPDANIEATPSASDDVESPSLPQESHSATPDEDSHELAETQDVDLVPAAEAQLPSSRLDFDALAERLESADDPIAQLKLFVGDIRTREAGAEGHPESAPCDLERYAARMLEEAGLFAKDVELPHISAVRLYRTHGLYLRIDDGRTPYLAKLRVYRLEAALGAIRFAIASLSPQATQQEAYRLNQGLARSIVAQSAPIDEPLIIDGVEDPDGEWGVRYGISQQIETLQLPYRPEVRYRTNVADGNVAMEVELPPADAFPSSCLVDGVGIVPTTGDMRQRACADHALRLALLLAACAFRCSSRVRHVWVAGIIHAATRRTCYLSVDFDRWRFSRIDLADVGDLAETYRSFAPTMRFEDGWLRPVRQTFHLEEERFCPKRRYMPVSLSSRRLDGRVAASLGTDHVSGLAIEEADGRTLVANAIMLRLAAPDDKKATLHNVRTVLDLAADDPDPTVRSAAERVVRGLVDGRLDDDPLTIGEEFVRGDALTRANDRAKELLMQQRPDEAQRVLSPVVEAIDAPGTYADGPGICHRYFDSYVERALYNRLHTPADGGKAVLLVPDAYFEAHLLLSVTHLVQGQPEEALGHALRIVELDPLSAHARLHLVKVLEVLGRDDEAMDQLNELLEEAHEPQGLGLAYYRMAYFQWKRGNVAAAQACYQWAMRYLPMIVPVMAMEMSVLYLQNPELSQDEQTSDQLEETLAAHGIPVAPTERTSEVFYECAQAALDAEIFPVARNFARVLGSFSTDDVIEGLIQSLEDAPDW